MNRARHSDDAARVCEQFVYSTVKITRLYDYQPWKIPFLEEFTRCAEVCFSDADLLARQTAINRWT